MDVKTETLCCQPPPAPTTTTAGPNRKTTAGGCDVESLLHHMSSSLAGRERLMSERADEIVQLRNQMHCTQQLAQRQQREQANELRRLERELFEARRQAACAEQQAQQLQLAQQQQQRRRTQQQNACTQYAQTTTPSQRTSPTRANASAKCDEIRALNERLSCAHLELQQAHEQLAECRRAERAEVEQLRQRAEKNVRHEREQGERTVSERLSVLGGFGVMVCVNGFLGWQICDLQKAVNYHVDTIEKLQQERQAQTNEIQQLQCLVSIAMVLD